MRLRDIEFGHVFNASGSRNLTGKGYWFHKVWRPFGLDYTGSTFVAKTTTLNPRAGNMRLKEDGETPKEWNPRCIIVKPFQGITLNAVGLSGPGAKFLLETGRWQQHTEPFLLSFMPVEDSIEKRLDELRQFVELLQEYLPGFRAPIGLQINFSCPNVGLDPGELIQEVGAALDIASRLNIPLIPKFNATVPIEPVVTVANEHPSCDAICMSNTIPWGKLPELIKWHKLFGSDTSPLAHLGGGGLGGKPLLPIVCAWIERAFQAGLAKPIIGCGGILSCADAIKVLCAGAPIVKAVELGSVSILRPWRVQGIIRHVNQAQALVSHSAKSVSERLSKL